MNLLAFALVERNVQLKIGSRSAAIIRHGGLIRKPPIEIGAGHLGASADALPSGRGESRQVVKASLVVGPRHGHDRRRVLHVAVHRLLRRVVEKRRERIELALRQRIELVIVTHSAAGG